MEKSFIREMEINFVLAVEDSCKGRGNKALYIVRNADDVTQCHLAGVPNDSDGTSVMAFLAPSM